jgi:hypothetical protein
LGAIRQAIAVLGCYPLVAVVVDVELNGIVVRIIREWPRRIVDTACQHGESTMDKIKPIFTATATATGGRNGHTEASDGR